MSKKDLNKTNLINVTIKKLGDKNKGHHHIILESIDDKHLSIGLTTKPKKGKSKKSGKNYKMEIDPLGTGKQSYMRRQGTIQNKKSYGNPKKGNMTTKDYEQAKNYGEVAKNKYNNKKNKTKK